MNIFNAKNFPYTYFKWEQDPTHNLVEDDKKQLVRFQMKTEQYIDLDTAYLEVQISIADYYNVLYPNGYETTSGTRYGLALDGPATALIENLKIYSNGRLVEHVDGYNDIGQIIHDFNMRKNQRDGKSELGLGKGGCSGKIPNVYTNGIGLSLQPIYTGATLSVQGRQFFFYPSHAQYPIDNQTGSASINAHRNPYYSAPKQLKTGFAYTFARTAAFRTPYSYWSRVMNGDFGFQNSRAHLYNFAARTQTTYAVADNSQSTPSAGLTPYCVESGIQIPYCPSLENPNKDVVLDGNQKFFVSKGQYQDLPKITEYMTFKVPIISHCLGVMRTGHQGLVDGRYLGQLNWEWRFNPTAFYTTGVGSEDQSGGVTAFPRLYKIKRVRMIFDTYHPTYTPADALGPRSFWANAWTVAHSQTFVDTRALSADHQINVGIKSARLMLTRFKLQDYLDDQKTFCREQYCISGNVTSYQVKMGSMLFPVNPVRGHAGQPYQTSTDLEDNTEFVDYFNRAMGTFLIPGRQKWTDRVSYAVNERPYITGNDTTTQNTEKIGGGTFFWEQKVPRVCYITRFDDQDGKFVRNLQNLKEYDFGWNGIDTTDLRPFTLSLKTDQIYYNPNPVELQILFYHDVYVEYTEDGIKTTGGYLN